MQFETDRLGLNMETGVLRRTLKWAKVWNAISEDIKAIPEDRGAVAKVLPPDLKRKLFETAARRHNPRHNHSLQLFLCLYLSEINGGRDRTRTCDLLRVKQREGLPQPPENTP